MRAIRAALPEAAIVIATHRGAEIDAYDKMLSI
jgi:hypothetical protein